MSKTQMKNATARKFFLHDTDSDRATDRPACFFAHPDADWGFWVNANGDVTIDTETSGDATPSPRIVESCRLAAVKYLRK